MIIIIATLVSRYCHFAENFDLDIVGEIPKGLPHPEFPHFSIVADVIVNSLLIAIVGYAISVSVAKIFAQKHKYKIDANQELMAHGASNIISSLFNCYPSSASLTRCVINESVGAKTQISGLFCSGIILVVLIWIAPFFETVPNCVLSAMIVVALKGMFLQVYDLPKAWHESPINGAIWLLTFLSTILLDIEYGLAAGLILSILSLVWRSNRPYIQVLGAFGQETGLYVDIKKGKNEIKEVPKVKLIKYIGGMNFATVEYFLKRVKRIAPMEERDVDISWIILDLSTVSSIDPASSKGIHGLVKDYGSVGKKVLFAGISTPVLETLIACDLVTQIGEKKFFPTVHDAVTFANSEINNISRSNSINNNTRKDEDETSGK